MAFHALMMPRNPTSPQFCLAQGHVHPPKGSPCPLPRSTPGAPPALTTTVLHSVSGGLPVLRISHHWAPTLCDFLSLFHLHRVFKVHPRGRRDQHLVSLDGGITVHGVDGPHSVCPLVCRQALALVQPFAYGERGCCEHLCMSVCLPISNSFEDVPRNCGSHGNFMFNF